MDFRPFNKEEYYCPLMNKPCMADKCALWQPLGDKMDKISRGNRWVLSKIEVDV